jgi:hypothetical protein
MVLKDKIIILLFQATVMILEDSTERAAHRMCDFLKSLAQSVIITPEQMAKVKYSPL